ncbi:MAG: ABC-F family ATP-binding cassette domain-containing protein [Candidatus Cloacimonetes bacterium]|nr:ABC-F family ATP-binding cassette domain-containing protein [Candidatus Cloacimonadota bacterium]MCF7868667.1 ABC-F family ATP-binding cassette domain-containing protein [Candidatus Cloacimonadota bacterium]
MIKNLISVDSLKKEFPGKIICDNVSFGISEGQKIGLIGVNGCGKSTLLKMLIGLEPIDSGKIILRNETTIGFLPQTPDIDSEITIYEHIYYSDNPQFKLLRKYHRILYKLDKNPNPETQKEQQKLQTEMDAKNVWDIEIKAQAYLSKLGFEDFNQKIGILSGGQKRRIDLARVLMDQPDILILDEPTNHLDIDTIEWFQEYLSDYKGTIIFVTHDRYFLDAVSNCIMDVENGKIRFYQGSYGFYLQRKEIELQDMQRKEIRRSAQLKKELKWLQRGAKARTSKPKNHLDRVKELIDKSYLTNDTDLDISFQSKRLGKTILEIKNISKSYDDKDLIKNFNYNFQKLDRIGIIGPNGCGKTTLLKMITDEIPADEGKIKSGHNTHFSYFKQNIEDFNDNISVLDYVKEKAEHIRTKDGILHSASEMLQRFLFDGKMQQQKIKTLSGGEKKRLFLLRSLMFGSNFIILDEPTNDLDIKTLEILEDYLDSFKGCILLVSHDRYFLDRVVDYLFIFEDDKIIKFPGNYSDYLLVKRYRDQQKSDETAKSKNRIKDVPKGLSYNEKRELQKLEKEIQELEERKVLLENKIENEADKLNPQEFSDISEELQKIEIDHTSKSERWLTLAEKSE